MQQVGNIQGGILLDISQGWGMRTVIASLRTSSKFGPGLISSLYFCLGSVQSRLQRHGPFPSTVGAFTVLHCRGHSPHAPLTLFTHLNVLILLYWGHIIVSTRFRVTSLATIEEGQHQRLSEHAGSLSKFLGLQFSMLQCWDGYTAPIRTFLCNTCIMQCEERNGGKRFPKL